MENQGKFLEMLQEIKEIATSQNNHMTKAEIKNYIGDEKMSETQMQAVYHYLGENNIEVEGYVYIPTTTSTEEKEDEATQKKTEDKTRRDSNLTLYQQELNELVGGDEDIEKLILLFLQGDDSIRNQIVMLRLPHVVTIAKKYEKRKVAIDELIAEGNMGLVIAMEMIASEREKYLHEGVADYHAFLEALDQEITKAMERFIDESTTSKDWENTVLAKTNLLHEATKYMTEEIGRVPTIDELSEYTKISREEINNIRRLSEDAKRVADSKETK